MPFLTGIVIVLPEGEELLEDKTLALDEEVGLVSEPEMLAVCPSEIVTRRGSSEALNCRKSR